MSSLVQLNNTYPLIHKVQPTGGLVMNPNQYGLDNGGHVFELIMRHPYIYPFKPWDEKEKPYKTSKIIPWNRFNMR